MRLDHVDLLGRDARIGQCLTHDPFLSPAVRSGEAVGGAVLVDRRALEDGQHTVPVVVRCAERLQGEHAHPLRERGPLGTVRKGPAAAIRSDHAHAACVDHRNGGRHDRDPTREGKRAIASPQRLRGHMDRDQGRGAGRVDGYRGALEAERVGNPAGDDAPHRPGKDRPARVCPDEQAVVAHACPGEDSDGRTTKPSRIDASVFQRLPGRFQRQPLLRVHAFGLSWADPEEGGVELGDVGEEAAVAEGHRARVLGIGVIDALEVPAAVVWKLGYALCACDQQLPEGIGRMRASGIAASHSNDGYRLVACYRRRCRRRRHPFTGEQPGKAMGQQFGRREIEDERRGKLDADRGAESVAQLDCPGRVHPEVLERLLRLHLGS